MAKGHGMCLLCSGPPHPQVANGQSLPTPVVWGMQLSSAFQRGGVPMCSMAFLFQEGRGPLEVSKVPELTDLFHTTSNLHVQWVVSLLSSALEHDLHEEQFIFLATAWFGLRILIGIHAWTVQLTRTTFKLMGTWFHNKRWSVTWGCNLDFVYTF